MSPSEKELLTVSANSDELALLGAAAESQPLYGEVPPNASLGRVIPVYLRHLIAGSGSKHTPRQYHSNLKKFDQFLVLQKIHDKPVAALTYNDLVDYVSFIKTHENKYADKSIALMITSLKHFFKWAHETAGLISANPAKKLEAHKAPQNIPPILTLAEYEHIQRLASDNPEIYCMILLLVEGGLKKEELLLATLRDFDLRNKFKVTMTVRNDDKRKVRRIDLPLTFLFPFNSFIDKLKSRNPSFDLHMSLFDYDSAHINKIIKAFIEEKNIKCVQEMTPQNLRHFGARMFMESHNMAELRAFLGLAPWEHCPELYQMYEKLKEVNI